MPVFWSVRLLSCRVTNVRALYRDGTEESSSLGLDVLMSLLGSDGLGDGLQWGPRILSAVICGYMWLLVYP